MLALHSREYCGQVVGKRAFLKVLPLLPRDDVNPVVGKWDVCFLCVLELVALLVIHLLKWF